MPIQRHAHGSEMNLEPNLTPLLDLVFQLITFFMLVINFKGASLDLSLKLPVLGSARPIEWKKGTEPIVINLRSDGTAQVYGEPIDPAEFFAAMARQVSTAKNPDKEAESRPVILRADERVPFSRINELMTLSREHGFENFALSAMAPAAQSATGNRSKSDPKVPATRELGGSP